MTVSEQVSARAPARAPGLAQDLVAALALVQDSALALELVRDSGLAPEQGSAWAPEQDLVRAAAPTRSPGALLSPDSARRWHLRLPEQWFRSDCSPVVHLHHL